MDECESWPCKFGGGVECEWSDRARADCYVCNAVRARLSVLSRLEREYNEMRRYCGALEHQNERLQAELERTIAERDEAWLKYQRVSTGLRE